MSTVNNVLKVLADSNGEIALGIEAAGVVIPLAKGLVQEIKQIATGSESVTYTVLIQMDGAELDAIDKLAEDDLAAINAELVKLGKPPVPTGEPPTPPITQ